MTLVDVDHVDDGNRPAVRCALCGETDGIRLVEGRFVCWPYCGRWVHERYDTRRQTRGT